MSTNITPQDVKHMAKLAHIPITEEEGENFANAFDETLKVVDQLKTVDTTGVEPTHQVTGLENISREDVVNKEAMFSQAEALANAAQTHQGYFVVPRIVNQED